MREQASNTSPFGLNSAEDRVLTVLIVDDSKLQRRILSACLEKWGYEVFEAESGKDGLEICKATRVDLVLSDWVMPEMDGLIFCRKFRALDQENYGYFILLTSKDSKDEIARGLDVGADDFLTKPVNTSELRARLNAGERILGMQQELVEKNRSISQSLNELQVVYRAIDRDLEEAKKLQQSLLPETFRTYDTAQVSLLLQPSGHIGGDMVGYYFNSSDRIGIFAFDVSGHGVSSALMTARLTGCLSAVDPSHSIALCQLEDGSYEPRLPDQIAALLNNRMLNEIDTDLYLTILLADVDLQSGTVNFVQAGHPHPALLSPGEAPIYIGDGGLPIGLIPDAEFQSYQCRLQPGDSLLIHSDGFTEAEDKSGRFLDQAGFSKIITKNPHASGPEFLADIVWETQAFSGGADVADDLSAVLLEFNA